MPESLVELAPAHVERARPLFANATYDRVYADAFFEARQPGRLFVDDGGRPRAAMLCRTYEYYFAGEPAPALRRFVLDAPEEAQIFARYPDLETARRGTMLGFYGMVAFTAAWSEALIGDHAGRLERIGRRAFEFPPGAEAHVRGMVARIPDGYRVAALDRAFAERVDLELDEVIGLCWTGYEGFARFGFGAAVVTEHDEIASVAYTIGVSSREVNLGVGTAEVHRRRGLATLASAACVVQALDRGLRPTWDCDDLNPASADLARKLGFTEQPSFVELAFPRRAGPPLSRGRWKPTPDPLGTRWRRMA